MSESKDAEAGRWHFLDKRSKALANNQGLKIEFDSHQDAEIGIRVLNALEAKVERLSEALLLIRRNYKWHKDLLRPDYIDDIARQALEAEAQAEKP